MAISSQHQDPAVLLQAEHAVTRVLAQARDPGPAYPPLLEAIGAALDWDFAAAWEIDDGTLRCAATWRRDGLDAAGFEVATQHLTLSRGEGLPGRVWATGRPARIPELDADPNFPRLLDASRVGLRSAVCLPVRGAEGMLGAIELFAREPHTADRATLETLTSLGRQIGQYVERCRARQAMRDSDARKSAILDAAFDCVITIDHLGRILEVNQATEQTFGYKAEEMAGQDMADLIIPPELRAEHRRGLARYLRTGREQITHPVEMPAMRADGSRFPVELAITRPRLDGPPVFTGYVRDITERKRAEHELRELAGEQAALGRVARLVASEDDPGRVFSVVTEEVGRLLGAQTSNMIRFEEGAGATVVGGWSSGQAPAVEVGDTVELDGPTAAASVYRTGRPARVDSYEGMTGELAARLRSLGFRSAVAAPITLAGRLWGCVIVSSVEPEPFPAGAEQRIAEFAKLTAQALANADAREQLAASRARLVKAADDERRRLERNLHDGAQQRLVALALMVRLAQRKLASDHEGAGALLARSSEELDQAMAELRELARGLHPAILTDLGLGPALTELAERAPVPVELTTSLEERLPDQVEAAAYYVVAEALTNVAKYAGACCVQVQLESDGSRLVVTVSDDGAGGADPSGGSGLRGLADRVEALGGRLEVSSPSGEGTTVRAAMPCR